MNYADIEMLHAYGGFTSPTEEDDALLEHFISAASAYADSYCKRRFALADDAVVTAHTFTDKNGLLMPPSDMLWLDDDLCSTPTYAEGALTVTLIPTTTPYNRIVRDDGSRWPDPTVVTGHWAYSMTPPVGITQAVLRMALWMFHQKESSDSYRPYITPGGILIMPGEFPKDIVMLLDPFRRMQLP